MKIIFIFSLPFLYVSVFSFYDDHQIFGVNICGDYW